MPPKQPLPPGFDQLVLNLYKDQGWSIKRICLQYRVSYRQVRRVLSQHHVKLRPAGDYTRPGSEHPHAKLTKEQVDQLHADLRANVSHKPLSIKYGVSRERIRQIAQTLGTPTGRELRAMKKSKKLAETAKERQERQSKQSRAKYLRYSLWRSMWAEGLHIRDMAVRLGTTPGTVSHRIAMLRRVHPGWFPLRHGPATED